MYIGVHGRPKPAAARNKERGVVMDVGGRGGDEGGRGGGKRTGPEHVLPMAHGAGVRWAAPIKNRGLCARENGLLGVGL